MKREFYFSEYMLRADGHTRPTGFAAAGIQMDIPGLCVKMPGGLGFHFCLPLSLIAGYIQRGVLA
jgi:hypothetical protein